MGFVKIGRHRVSVKSIIVTTINLAILVTVLVCLFYTVYQFATVEEPAAGTTTKQTVEMQKKTGPQNQVNTQRISASRKFLGVVIILLVISIFFNAARSEWVDGEKWYKQKFWRHPMGVVIYLIIATYLLIAFLLPGLWNLFWEDQIFFWSLTIGIIVLAGLKTMKGDDGKPLPAAQKGAVVFVVILVFGLIAQISVNPRWESAEKADIDWKFWGDNKPSVQPVSQTTTVVSGSVPAEVALPIICGCESSGIPGVIKHFEDDGVTPLKNKPKPGEKASSATGGCQILSDLHDERAKKMGHDIKTSEGNMAYAKILYNESTPPTKHWEGVPGNTSKACWEPRLRALTLRSGEEVVYVVMATTGKWSDETVRPPQDKSTDYDGGGKKYTILWNGQIEENIPREKESRPKMPEKVYWFKLKSREEESIPISIKFY